jgi:hypothetical protein
VVFAPRHKAFMADLIHTMRLWSGRQRNRAVWLAFAGVTLLSVALAWKLGSVFREPDANQYLAMANHRKNLIMLPFASRQLGILIVQAFARLLHLSIAHSFFLEGALCFGVFLGTVLYLLVRSGAPRWMLPAIAGMFFWPQQLEDLLLPDLLYAALICCFLLLLWRGHMMLAALMMLPLMVARESTIFTLVCFLIAGGRRLRLREAAASVLATAAGILIVHRLTLDAQPNQENISPIFYMAAKMPWNFLKNVLGLNPWADVYRACEVPRWQMPLHLGPLHAIGLCAADFSYPLRAIAAALASFGLLPLLLFQLRRVRIDPASRLGRNAFFLRFCVLYGIASFLLTPLLGESFLRLYFYSWPLFLVAIPILMGAARASLASAPAALLFLAMHLSLSWSLMLLGPWPVILIAMVVYPVGWLLLRRAWRTSPETGPATSSSL